MESSDYVVQNDDDDMRDCLSQKAFFKSFKVKSISIFDISALILVNILIAFLTRN